MGRLLQQGYVEVDVELILSVRPLQRKCLCAQQFPYQVQLQINTSSNSYLCGGTLVSSSNVVTAAHCFYGKAVTSGKVYAGSIYWYSISAQSSSMVRLLFSGHSCVACPERQPQRAIALLYMLFFRRLFGFTRSTIRRHITTTSRSLRSPRPSHSTRTCR